MKYLVNTAIMVRGEIHLAGTMIECDTESAAELGAYISLVPIANVTEPLASASEPPATDAPTSNDAPTKHSSKSEKR